VFQNVYSGSEGMTIAVNSSLTLHIGAQYKSASKIDYNELVREIGEWPMNSQYIEKYLTEMTDELPGVH
jgi:hypothetical protein